VTAALDAQGVLQPSQPGYWQIWGATARDIRPGDLLMVRWEDKGSGPNPSPPIVTIGEYEVDTINFDPFWCPRVVSTPTDDHPEGEVFRVGALQKITLLRKGTHNTLSPHCR